MSKSYRLFSGVVLLYFIIALEVLIMISPFAAFFYARVGLAPDHPGDNTSTGTADFTTKPFSQALHGET
jgi:hypothetical protein